MFPYIKREMAKFEDREREMIQKTETVWATHVRKMLKMW